MLKLSPLKTLILKIFTSTFLGYLLFSFIIDLVVTGFIKTQFNSISALIMAITFTIGIGLMTHQRLKKYGGKKITKTMLDVNQKKTISSNLKLEEVKYRLEAETGFKDISILANSIIAKTSISIYSWGEKIVIKQTTPGVYQVSSRPRLSTILVDYGSSFRNVKSLERLLSN